MAVIAHTNMVKGAPFELTRTSLGASDTLTNYVSGTGQWLILDNTTASPVDVTIDGSGGTTISPEGYGGTVSVASGKIITVPASKTYAVKLDAIAAFLQGTVAVTGGTGVIAHVIKF